MNRYERPFLARGIAKIAAGLVLAAGACAFFVSGYRDITYKVEAPEASRLTGRISFELRAPDGTVRERREIRNLVVDAGKAGIASRINGSGAEAAFGHIAIGIGTTGAAAGNTTLESEITTNGGQRASCTASRITTDVTNDTAQCVTTFSFTGSFAVTEAGYLNAASSGVLLARQVFSAINVVSGDSLQVTWKIDVD